MLSIQKVRARQLYNSRGEPTLEVEIWVDGGYGVAIAPSGSSVGKHEARFLPEGGPMMALKIFDELAKRLTGVDASNLKEVTNVLKQFDGTKNLSKIGGAVAYCVTLATAKACSDSLNVPLYRLLSPNAEITIPIPLGNIVGGGRHAPFAPRMDFQELLVAPTGATSFREAVGALIAVHNRVGTKLAKKDPHFTGGRGDEGAWVSSLSDLKLLDLVRRACEEVESELGFRLGMGVDMASSTIWDEKEHIYRYGRNGFVKDESQQFDFVTRLIDEFDLFYVEDPFHEEAFDSFQRLTREASVKLICGDDLVTTNMARLNYALEKRACNAVIMKVNQVGCLSDALDFAKLAIANGLTVVASHRSGDNPDCLLAHLAVASRSKLIKTGVLGGERIAKLNELLRIEERGLKLARVI